MLTRTDFNGRTTTYTYDNMNRLLSKTADPYFAQNHLGSASVTYTYNPQGLRATMVDGSGTTSYGYDGLGRLTARERPEGNLFYSYDRAGNEKQDSGSGNATYGYDALNRLVSVANSNTGTTTYTYDAVGNLATATLPNGVAHSYTYDVKNRLKNLGVNNGSGPIASYAYTVDAAGHRTSVTEKSGRTVNYAYDNLYRLANETIASDPHAVNGAVNYSYDPVGNRLRMTSSLAPVPAGTFLYNANDQLQTDAYDANGNTVNSGGLNYGYDFENRLVQQGGISIVYDGDGNRVSKTVAGVKTKYWVDVNNPTGYAQVLQEIPPNNFPVQYYYGLELLERYDTNNSRAVRYYVHDGHGSVRALTDSSGNVTDTYDYDAFGNEIHSTGTSPNNYLFAGEQFDPDLNLYYNRARYLNTNTGRFWTMDTFEGNDDAQFSLHKYLYGEGDPANRFDRSGNQVEALIGMAVEDILDVIYPVNPFPTIAAASRAATTYSQRLVEFTEIEEGFENRPHGDAGRDPVTGQERGNCTIGYGHKLHNGGCTAEDYSEYSSPLSQEEGEQMLRGDLFDDGLQYVHQYVKVPLAQKELDALTDFTFNAGGGSLQRSQVLILLNEGLYSAVAIVLPFQNIRPGSVVEAGLKARRQDEAYLWTTGIYAPKGRVIP